MCNTNLQILKYIIFLIVNLISENAFIDFCQIHVSVVNLWLQLSFDLPNGVESQSVNSFIHNLMSLALTCSTTKSFQSCPTLCDPRDDSPPGSPVPGILQARTLEWVAVPFSNA